MSEPSISIDTDAAAAASAEWRAYADRVEQHGSHHPVPIEHLSTALGDIYADYIEAKAGEYEAREAAYRRVAERARGHADRLAATRQNLTNADDESAMRINTVLDT